ncbi:Fc.00g039670.m01.CDS01 [Cosmosporella sp. VM-42]
MGAFPSMAMMGFFPVAGQDVYLLTPPFFPEVRLRSRGGGGGVSMIRKTGDTNGIYIQSAKLNGKKYTKNWISHDVFVNGGVLELVVGTEESTDWGTRDEDVPPSGKVGPRS